MNEEQLQRIEKGFAAATPLSIYNPHGDRALADIMVDLESRTIVPALIAEVRRLRAKLDAVPVDAILADYDGWGTPETSDAIDKWINALYVEKQEAQP